MAKQDFRFAHPLRVRWAEVDMQGIVFNAHYLTYFDVAIYEYWRAAGLDYHHLVGTLGVDAFVVKSTVEYHASARFDDEVEVCVRCARIGRSSLQFLLEIHRGDEHLISGEIVYVCAHPAERRSLPVPQPLRAAFERFEGRALGAAALPAAAERLAEVAETQPAVAPVAATTQAPAVAPAAATTQAPAVASAAAITGPEGGS